MARVRKQLVSDLIGDLKKDISFINSSTEIPDIITFCEAPEWLGLSSHPTNPIFLYPIQKIVLKAFYRGSPGNEDLRLTDEEIKLCEELGLNNDDKGNLLGKYFSGEIFSELILVWGRRASKDFVVSLIALYEAMKLLESPGGDPYSLYELSSSNTINVLTVANSKPQAHLAFKEIKQKLLYSPYFQDKFTKEGIGTSSIFLLTPRDKEENKRLRERGVLGKKGSIGIIVGHSNSDSLVGIGCMVLILDEFALYKTSGAASSGDVIYQALQPTTKTYVRRIYKTNEDGEIEVDENDQKIIKERIYDGKIISISSPRAKEGKFYELFKGSPTVKDRLTCRLATWQVNPTHTRTSLRETSKSMTESEFNMEFGAEFSGSAMENCFTEEQVNSCFIGHPFEFQEYGRAGRIYFCHLDPAITSHNYALTILHKEFFMDVETRKADYFMIVDHIKIWTPSQEQPVSTELVINYVIELKRRFHLAMVTYDQFASAESVLRLRKAGIPNKETRFTRTYKMSIYRELENQMNMGKLKIPYHEHLKNELLELQRRFTYNGFKIFPKQDGDGVKSDDISDTLAGAVFVCVNQKAHKLPLSKLARMGPTLQSNSVVWRNMQGGITGIGSGGSVARALEKRSRAYPPRYRR